MALTVYDRTGKQIGSYEIDPTDLAPRINKQLLHDVVVMYQSNQRLGTAQTKSRGMVAGTTKKMYRQKGTGNARAGSRRSGIRRGGGHIFHKTPRDWTYRLPRKALQLATRMALASKIRDAQVTVIDDLKFSAPKTREMAAIISALKCDGETLLGRHGRSRRECLHVDPEHRPRDGLAGRRIECLDRTRAATAVNHPRGARQSQTASKSQRQVSDVHRR